MQGEILSKQAGGVPLSARWQQVAASFGLSPAGGGAPYQFEVLDGVAHVAFTGRVTRGPVLNLVGEIEGLGATVETVRINVAGAKALDAKALAVLAALCVRLEKLNLRPILDGLPPELHMAAIEAQLHHLIDLG